MKTIFVSSTFRDMDFERDLIQRRVVPAVNRLARRYGDEISCCDLRWGVNTMDMDSEEGAGKVLSVCLDEIRKCRPYMIVLLGDRYGWIPDESLIAGALERAGMGRAGRERADIERASTESASIGRGGIERAGIERPDMEGTAPEPGSLEMSVTELEIEYGALWNPDQLEHTLFYFRRIEGPAPEICRPENRHYAEKLEQLKARIVRLAGGQVREYCLTWNGKSDEPEGLEDFAAMVERDICAQMRHDWEETARLTSWQRELRFQWEYAREKSARFTSREQLIGRYISMLESGCSLIGVRGGEGMGKTTLMSRLACVLEERGKSDQGWDVLPLFCGSTESTDSAEEILKFILYYLEEQLQIPHYTDTKEGRPCYTPEINRQIGKAVEAYSRTEGKRLVILVDGVEQLSGAPVRDPFLFIPWEQYRGLCLNDSVQMIFSSAEAYPVKNTIRYESIPAFCRTEKAGAVNGILRASGKELSRQVIGEILEKPGSSSPLYISMILWRLQMMDKEDFDRIRDAGDGMEAITAYQISMVRACPEDVEGICGDIIDLAARRLGGEFVYPALRYLAVSRHGLRERDLEAILTGRGISWSALDFSLFIHYLNIFFICRSSGHYEFSHKSIRRVVLSKCRDMRQTHRDIYRYLMGLELEDAVWQTETAWHILEAGDARAFLAYIAEGKEKGFRYLEQRSACPSYADMDLFAWERWAGQELYRHSLMDGGRLALDMVKAVMDNDADNSADENLMRFLYRITGQCRQPEQPWQRELAASVMALAVQAYQAGRIDKKTLDDGLRMMTGRRELFQEEAVMELLESHTAARYEALEKNRTVENVKSLNESVMILSDFLLGTDKQDGRDAGTEDRILSCLETSLLCLDAIGRMDREEISGNSAKTRELSEKYLQTGRGFFSLERDSSKKKGIGCIEKGLRLQADLAEICRSGEACERMYAVISRSADMLLETGDLLSEENRKQALGLIQICIDLTKALHREFDPDYSGWVSSVLPDCYLCEGDLYIQLGGRENAERALQAYLNGKSIIEEYIIDPVVQEMGTIYGSQIRCYERLLDAYRLAGKEKYTQEEKQV